MLLACGFALLAAPTGATAKAGSSASADRVLTVVSGNVLDEGNTRPGFEMDELSQAYAVFADNGLDIDIASPRWRGGRCGQV